MGKTVKPQTVLQRIKNDPECDLCRNHGIREKSRGHKFNCPFRSCPCHECCWSKLRRIVNRNQQQRRRQHEQMIRNRSKTVESMDVIGTATLIQHPTPEDELTPLSYVFLKFCDGNPRAAMLKVMDVYRDLTRYESPPGSQGDDSADMDAITPSPNGRANGWPMPLPSIGAYSYPNSGFEGGMPPGNNCCSPICITPNDGEPLSHPPGRMACPNVNVAEVQKMEVPSPGINSRDRNSAGPGHVMFGNNAGPQNLVQNRPDRNTMSFMSMNSNTSMMHGPNQFRHHNHRPAPSYGSMTVGRYGYLDGGGPSHGILPGYNTNCQHPARYQMSSMAAHATPDMSAAPPPNNKMSAASMAKSDRGGEDTVGPDQNNLQVD